MKNIEISLIGNVRHPMLTPAGWVEKKFKAVIPNYKGTGAGLTLEVLIRDAHEKNGNRVVVENLVLDLRDSTSLGITGDILRQIPVQKVAEECVLHAIEFFYPATRPNRKTSLKVPSASDVSMTELVAATRNSLGLNPSAVEVQKALAKQGVQLEEGTIRNYLTKAKKAGLLNVVTDAAHKLPDSSKNFTPDSLSAEAALIDELRMEAAGSGKPPISPQEYRRQKALAEKLALDKAIKKAQVLQAKRKIDIAKRNAPLKKSPQRKEGK
jgi:hypothetical protein